MICDVCDVFYKRMTLHVTVGVRRKVLPLNGIILSDNKFIRFGSKLYKQIVGIPMGTNRALVVADFFCYEKGFMLFLSVNIQKY